MRTTVNLEPDVLEVARSLAVARNISLGAAISLLVRRAVEQPAIGSDQDLDTRFPTFTVSETAAPFGTEDVRQALEDE